MCDCLVAAALIEQVKTGDKGGDASGCRRGVAGGLVTAGLVGHVGGGEVEHAGEVEVGDAVGFLACSGSTRLEHLGPSFAEAGGHGQLGVVREAP